MKRGVANVFVICLITTLIFLSAFPAQGAAIREDYNSAIALDDQHNRYLMIFTGHDGSHADIYGQFVNLDGIGLGDEFVISDTSSDVSEMHPSVAYDSINQNFFIVWEDCRNASSGTDIYGQLIHADGTLVGQNLSISNAGGNHEHPSVAYDGYHQRFFVVWDDLHNSAGHIEKYGQFVKGDATLDGTCFVIKTDTDIIEDHKGGANNDSGDIDTPASATASDPLAAGSIVLSSVTPNTFGPGAILTLSGSGFGTKKGTVKIGTASAKILSWSDTSITCSLASGKAGTYAVKVVIKKVGESNVVNATLSGPAIESITPPSGNPNITVTINGHYFGAKKPTVYFTSASNKKKTAKVTAYSDTQISVSVPKLGMGTYKVSMKNSVGTSNEIQFAVGNTLTVSINPSGGGSVTGTGIDCPGDCADTYNAGAGVTLTATPNDGYEFSGWTGCDSPSGNVCEMTINTSKSVTANFTLQSYTITATAGIGGSISPSGNVVVNHGANQAFSISPNTNYTIGNVVVDGTSVGPMTSYNFTNVTGNHTITVSFNSMQQYSLHVSKSGAGSGVVSSTPGGIDCGSDCNESYSGGTVVTLTATPDEGSEFANWAGCDSPSGSVCSMTIDSNKSVTANFTAQNPYQPFTKLGSAWIFTTGTITGVLTFVADTSNPETKGSYMLAMKYNNNSGGGVQTGDYTYNPSTGAFSVSSSSIRESNSGLSGFKNQSGNETIIGSTDTLVYSNGSDTVFTATKISSASNSLVGSWLNVDSTTNNITVLTFMDGTNYAYAFNVAEGQSDPNGGVSGVEFGTYSYTGSTLRNLSVSVDTNGKAGFAELPASGINMPLSGDTITLPARSSSVSAVVLQKVQ